MEELRIKCPSCGIILDVRNSKNEDVKRIVCPHCQKHLAVTFHELSSHEHQTVGVLCYGEAVYPLKEGTQTVGIKDPQSRADIQIATGDSRLCKEHVRIKVIRLANGNCKHLVTALSQPVWVCRQPLQQGDEVVLSDGDELQLGDTLLILKMMEK